MRSDNLQLPCVQPPTSSYNFQPPDGCHGRHGRHGHGGHVAMMVLMVSGHLRGLGLDFSNS